jgi:mannose-6-phosphate isomerase-like protein (cupin superfamily)
MRTFDPNTTDFGQVGPITVARWEQYRIEQGMMPFDAMWYTVPAGGASARDEHPEPELSIVISGTAHVEVGGEIVEIPSGRAFLFSSKEAHVIHNRSAEQELMIFSAYWMPLTEGSDPTDHEVETAGV